MKQYVIMVKEGDRLYGRVPDKNSISGYIVFLHNEVENKRPGLFEISNIELKTNDKSKYGFVRGKYVDTEDFDYNNLTLNQLSTLGSIGYISDLYKYNEKSFISIKDPNVLDNVYYMAFMIDGKIRFMKRLKYMNSYFKYIRDLSYLERKLFKNNLTSQARATSFPILEQDMMLDKNSLMYNNLDKIIWRRIVKSTDCEDYCIAMYRCMFNGNINEDLYNEILEYNKSVNKDIRENIDSILDGMNNKKDIQEKVFKTLKFYGLE